MQTIQLSEATAARRTVYLSLVDATDGITMETGEAAGQPQFSKNGAAFGNTSGTLSHIANGIYSLVLTQGECDTLGIYLIRYKSANTAEFQMAVQIVAYNPYDAVRLGLTALPNANAEAAGGLFTRGTGAGQVNQAANGQLDANVVTMTASAITATAIANGAIDLAAIASDCYAYQMKVLLIDDNTAAKDRWLVAFFKNGTPIYSGITVPTLQVVKASDGTDLIATQTLTQIGATGWYQYVASSSERVSDGAGHVAKVTATIDGSSRTWSQPAGRDSA